MRTRSSRTIGLMMGLGLTSLGCGDDLAEGGAPLGPVPDQEQSLAANVAAAAGTGANVTIPVCQQRTDTRTEMMLHAGIWGNWADCTQLCPAGSYAYRINVKSRPQHRAGPCPEDTFCLQEPDDVGMTAVSLHCFDKNTGAFTGYVTSTEGTIGVWLDTLTAGSTSENTGNPIISGQLRVDFLGFWDFTAANAISVVYRNSPIIRVVPNHNFTMGQWANLMTCPTGEAVCGIRTRVQPLTNASLPPDDTQLNGVKFQCCAF